MISNGKIAREEYAVEVFNKDTEDFVYQVDVFSSCEDAVAYMDDHPIEDDSLIYGITCVSYNKEEEEVFTDREYYHAPKMEELEM